MTTTTARRWTATTVSPEQLDRIKVLFRTSDTLTLYGIPYPMRPGQQPRDILEGARKSQEDALSRPYGTYGAQARPCPPEEWIWLGTPGWWGTLTTESQQAITAFLADKNVPGGPNEWCEVS